MHLNVVGPPGQRLISGFDGQLIVVLPRNVVPLNKALLPTDVGCFPKAAQHFTQRPRSASQAISMDVSGLS